MVFYGIGTVWFGIICFSMVNWDMVWYCLVWFGIVQYCLEWYGMVLRQCWYRMRCGMMAEAVLCLILSAWLGLNWGNSVRLKAEAFHKVGGGNIFMGLNLIKRVN